MKNNVKILLLSLLIPKEIEEEVRRKSRNTMQDAANAFQWKIINGIEKNISDQITIYNSLPINSFPENYNDWYISTTSFQHHPYAKDINIGSINVKYLKQMFLGFNLKKHVKKWAKEHTVSKKVIIAYTLRKDMLAALKKAKKCNPNIVTCVIVADLPEYNDLSSNKSSIKTAYQKWNALRVNKKLAYIDSYVLFTEHMANYLKIDKPYVVVEGIATDIFATIPANDVDRKNKIIFYAGTLHKKFGIINLLDAFSLIQSPNYRLMICGIGDSIDVVEERMQNDSRIEYLGQLPREEVLGLIIKATTLVNPRQNNEIFTKYSFPSKNLEYLSSGIPLVAYKLDGIPDEYDEYIQYVKDNSTEALSDKLKEICEKSDCELQAMGAKARDLVINKKNAVVQTKKIIDMIIRVAQTNHPDYK